MQVKIDREEYWPVFIEGTDNYYEAIVELTPSEYRNWKSANEVWEHWQRIIKERLKKSEQG